VKLTRKFPDAKVKFDGVRAPQKSETMLATSLPIQNYHGRTAEAI
jgi:hypothetical protein